MIKIKDSEIINEYSACVYCGSEARGNSSYRGCCGEIHFEDMYETSSGDVYYKSEVEVIYDSKDNVIILPVGLSNSL